MMHSNGRGNKSQSKSSKKTRDICKNNDELISLHQPALENNEEDYGRFNSNRPVTTLSSFTDRSAVDPRSSTSTTHMQHPISRKAEQTATTRIRNEVPSASTEAEKTKMRKPIATVTQFPSDEIATSSTSSSYTPLRGTYDSQEGPSNLLTIRADVPIVNNEHYSRLSEPQLLRDNTSSMQNPRSRKSMASTSKRSDLIASSVAGSEEITALIDEDSELHLESSALSSRRLLRQNSSSQSVAPTISAKGMPKVVWSKLKGVVEEAMELWSEVVQEKDSHPPYFTLSTFPGRENFPCEIKPHIMDISKYKSALLQPQDKLSSISILFSPLSAIEVKDKFLVSPPPTTTCDAVRYTPKTEKIEIVESKYAPNASNSSSREGRTTIKDISNYKFALIYLEEPNSVHISCSKKPINKIIAKSGSYFFSPYTPGSDPEKELCAITITPPVYNPQPSCIWPLRHEYNSVLVSCSGRPIIEASGVAGNKHPISLPAPAPDPEELCLVTISLVFNPQPALRNTSIA